MTAAAAIVILLLSSGDAGSPDLSSAEPVVREQVAERIAALEHAEGDQERAAAAGALAMTYHAYDLLGAAEVYYVTAINLQLDDFRWHYYYAHVCAERGRTTAATLQFEAALALKPEYLPGILRFARLRLELHELDEAQRLYERVLEKDPDEAEAVTGLGRVAFARGEYERAAERFRRSLSLAPQASETHHLLGLALVRAGRRSDARPHLERGGELRAARADPMLSRMRSLDRGGQGYQDRGSALLAAGELDRAREAFSRGVEARPQDPRAHTNLGYTRLRSGDVEGASADFRRALAIDPDYPHAHFNMGTILSARGNEEAAIAHYRAALRSDPAMVSARFNLANALRRAGQYEESIREYREVLEAEPAHARARLQEALALARLERYAEARDRLEQGYRVLPEDPWLRQALVRVLAASPVDAVRDGGRAVELAAGLAIATAPVEQLAAYAMALAEAGRFDEALRYQQGALAVHLDADAPDDALSRRLRSNLGLYEEKRPCRSPWRVDGPELSPRPRRPSP